MMIRVKGLGLNPRHGNPPAAGTSFCGCIAVLSHRPPRPWNVNELGRPLGGQMRLTICCAMVVDVCEQRREATTSPWQQSKGIRHRYMLRGCAGRRKQVAEGRVNIQGERKRGGRRDELRETECERDCGVQGEHDRGRQLRMTEPARNSPLFAGVGKLCFVTSRSGNRDSRSTS